MNVLLINGHPRKESLCHSLSDAYAQGALEAGVSLKKLDLIELKFEPNVTHQHMHEQYMEPDIKNAQDLFLWANHIVFVYPTWWGTMPGLLKSFLDRVLTSGFAFREIEGGTGYEGLLKGRTAQIITTMDTPNFVYRFLYGAPGHNAMRKATLGFCGFKMLKTIRFGAVRYSSGEQRIKWIERARRAGKDLAAGTLSRVSRGLSTVMHWLKAIRLQFYPMSFIAYTVGAYGAAAGGAGFDRTVFWIGYAWLFFLEVATVLSNDYFDFKSDTRNKFFSPFTGGSRVLVEKLLDFRQVRVAIIITLLLSFISLGSIFLITSIPVVSFVMVCGALFILAIGYTVPPVKLSYRGLGELTVGITHSFALIVCGYMFQGGNVTDNFSWLLGLPLFLGVLPSIILAGIPDREADRSVEKRTLAVRFGKRGAAKLAIICTIMAALATIIFSITNVYPDAFRGILIPVIPHSILLIFLLSKYIRKENPPERIDGLLVAALTYIFWFGVIPLINLA